MQFDEIDAGDFLIYAGAIERPDCNGYDAAVVIVRKRRHQGGRDVEAFRDDHLGGYTWSSKDEALRFAINTGRDTVMCRVGQLW